MVFFIPAAIGSAVSIGAQLGLRSAPAFARGSRSRFIKHYGRQWGARIGQGFPFGFGYAAGTYTGFPQNYQKRRKYGSSRSKYMPFGYGYSRRSYGRYGRRSYGRSRRYSRYTMPYRSRRRYY